MLVLTLMMRTTAFSADLTINSFAPYAGQTNIQLQASGDVIFNGGSLPLPVLQPGASGQLSVQAGNDIVIQNGTRLSAGQGWSISFVAGNSLVEPGTVEPGFGNVTLTGTASLTSLDGSVSLLAGNGVTVGTGYIDTTGGGSINIDAVSGSVNAGTRINGFVFLNNPATPYVVDPNPGGIGTAAGGDVNIIAGGNIVSLLPTGPTAKDGGCGAFGSAQGNVTLTAGGNVTGHYVVRNGAGIINAGQNAGTAPAQLSLSVVNGSWNVTAAQNILLQEVRNPNGIFNNLGTPASASRHFFDYAPSASVGLNAGNSVQLSGQSLPRTADIPIGPIYPPTLNIHAGAGGIQIGASLILFPSANGQLTLATTNGGPLASLSSSPVELVMSDSAATSFTNPSSFGSADHASTPVHLSDPLPVQLNISGDMNDVSLVAPKHMNVQIGGNALNSPFAVQNLGSSDISIFSVTGDILNLSELTTITFASVPNLGAFSRAVDQPSGLTASGVASLAKRLSFDPVASTLTLQGSLTVLEEQAMVNLTVQATNPLTGALLIDGQGNPVLEVVQVIDSTSAQALFTQSQNIPSVPGSGCLIAGPGALNLNAHNMDLGFTTGIQSVGPFNNHALAALGASGANININLDGDLDMISTTISSIAGGEITVNALGRIKVGARVYQARNNAVRGIFTTVKANISVITGGDITLDGSRIAAYDGGNIFVSSLAGSFDDALPGSDPLNITKVFGNPVQTSSFLVPGNGVLATALPGSVQPVGDITVQAGQDVLLGCGAITQEPLNGNFSIGPTITIKAFGNVNTGSTCPAIVGVGTINISAGGVIGTLLQSQLNVTNLTAVAGTDVQFTVTAGGIAPFGYKWYKNGTNLPDATGLSLSLTNVSRLNAGMYSVVVSNVVGAVTNNVSLHVLVPQLLSATFAPSNQVLSVSFADVGGGLLSAEDAGDFVIQTSTNLIDWVPTNLPVSTNLDGGLSFQLPLTSSPSCGFYRILSQ